MTAIPQRILVTGGAGFIGSAVVRRLVRQGRQVLTYDKLTYAGNLASLAEVHNLPGHSFVQADICDGAAFRTALAEFRPDLVMHLAAESHVDRSIDGPGDFIRTNILGTYTLLEESLAYWRSLDGPARGRFRFHHISTDEVFGTLGGGRAVPRGHALPAQLALFGLQGLLRPSGAGLVPHLWPAGGDVELLEQLWAVPFPGKS
ncbi:GDP-mannose 4,6-dehydratase [Ancylobacter dichloromethanicus]